MTTRKPVRARPSTRTLARARKQFAMMTDAMHALIARVKAGELPEGAEADKILMGLKKSAQTALELEIRFEADNDAAKGGGELLDLARARLEIGRRLDRIRNASAAG